MVNQRRQTMPVNWEEMRREMSPIKDYDALRGRWMEAFSHPCLMEAYNFTMREMAEYTRHLLGEDARDRYEEYAHRLIETFGRLEKAGVKDLLDLTGRIDTRGDFEEFIKRTGIGARDVMAALKYLAYWVIPSTKLLSGLVDKESPANNAILILRDIGIRTNLDILEKGRTLAGRKSLAKNSDVAEELVSELVNRADLSRLPWASKATISNILGAGYKSLHQLANADPERLYRDFYKYGTSIGKNLKLGNEIESSHRIAKIMPLIVK